MLIALLMEAAVNPGWVKFFAVFSWVVVIFLLIWMMLELTGCLDPSPEEYFARHPDEPVHVDPEMGSHTNPAHLKWRLDAWLGRNRQG